MWVNLCTNEASDHRLTLRRPIENASSTDLNGLELNSEKSTGFILDHAPMLYLALRSSRELRTERRYEKCELGKEKRPVCDPPAVSNTERPSHAFY